ncbi:MAG: putative ABC transporter permease [Clostridia bacterium]|nr:putative ABC transporter permease [Clostridia bacterium]
MKFVDVIKKIRNVFEWFLVYCFCGWIYEVVWWMMIEENLGFINRGVLFGPWLPIYGFGMLIMLAVVKLFKIKKPIWIFLVGMLLATAAEFAGSYIMQWIFGYFLWDYSGMFLNFEGRIAFKTSLFFGLLILFGVYWLHPRMVKLQQKWDKSVVRNVIFGVVTSAFLFDVVYTFFIKK